VQFLSPFLPIFGSHVSHEIDSDNIDRGLVTFVHRTVCSVLSYLVWCREPERPMQPHSRLGGRSLTISANTPYFFTSYIFARPGSIIYNMAVRFTLLLWIPSPTFSTPPARDLSHLAPTTATHLLILCVAYFKRDPGMSSSNESLTLT
jgi:hypothetical protein